MWITKYMKLKIASVEYYKIILHTKSFCGLVDLLPDQMDPLFLIKVLLKGFI